MAAKSKSKKIKTKGAKPVPCGDEPDPYYQRLAEDRYEQSCWQNHDELRALLEQPDTFKQIDELAGKGFKEAQKRKEDQRWPLFDSENKADVSKDLPQAACILLMFHDVFQELQGLADYENALITPELRVEYSEVISELREQMNDYQGAEQEADLFTICMVCLKQQLSMKKRKETEYDTDAKQNKSTKLQKNLQPSRQLALNSFIQALCENEALVKAKLAKIYIWIMDPEHLQNDKNPYKGVKEKPVKKTWGSYLRQATKHYGTSTDAIREKVEKDWLFAKSKGHDVVYAKDIDYRSSQLLD